MSIEITSADGLGKANVVDYLEALLRQGRARSIDELLKLVPDEPLICLGDFDQNGPLPAGARVLVIAGTHSKKQLLSDGGMLSRAPLTIFDGSITPRVGDVLVTRFFGCHKVVHWDWSKKELALSARFPGVQLDYTYCEARKYNSPLGEPLSAFVRELLATARSHWSVAVHAYANGWAKGRGVDVHCTNLQFRDWLHGYMDDPDNWFWRWDGRFDEAAQIVRLACGLPRFARTRRAGQ